MGHELTIEPLGETITVEDDQTILDACLRAGIWLPHACGHDCGTCKIEVADGEVDHADASDFALMEFERQEGKTLACTARLLSDVTIEAEIDEDPDQRRIAIADHTATVAAIVDLTHDVKGIRLDLGGASLDFQAGQYINLDIPGIAGSRAFSIANPPGESGHVDLQIRRVPGGRGTGWLHDHLKIGDRLSLTGPFGRFFVRRSRGGPLIFLAGGTGVSSPRAMILDLLASGYGEPMTLVHGVRTAADLYGREEFEALAARHPDFRYVPALSDEPADSGWQGARGFVHEVANALFDGNFEGQTAYLCGPPPMIEACIGALMKGRLFERHIFTERFLTAGDSATKKSPLFRGI
ncbi:MAG: 2Fe-2S iron-sulfur cluster binding domain-containing protein [Hyphomicrobiales bacterium]